MTPLRVYPRVCGGTIHSHHGRPGNRPVYPRVCGGTSCGDCCDAATGGGLSPRVRGNLQAPSTHAAG